MNGKMRKFLLWFAHEHVEFRAAVSSKKNQISNLTFFINKLIIYLFQLQEIESILKVFKIQPTKLKTVEKSPNHVRNFIYKNKQ